ncbi:MAG TPA: sigma-54 dependent transcriptional regulator [Bryobacterales bacterium]|jgi:DNA-binding NtrC family response regulator|nr:sigma-54 dependent transcriptional regulator [Bryobacterales bacterium]
MSAPSRRHVLIVDDEESQRQALATLVASWGYTPQTAEDGQDALDKLAAFPAQVIVTDLSMPRLDGFALLRRLREQGAAPPTIVLTAYGSIENAVATVHDLGAYWFLEKPIQPAALQVLLERALEKSNLSQEKERLQRRLAYSGELDEMVGRSRLMQHVFSMIQQVAPTSACVLITGESGTGKEMVARAIHQLSSRREGPFIAINCAALPETLMESELFGHEKGAFTGAAERRAGCFELAQGGTLLLDEIGEMQPLTQAKLLRVLEDGRVRRLGAKSELQVDVRVIAATNKVPEVAVARGELRQDLYYRLNVFHIQLPPLRDRREDIPLIAEALLRDLNRKHSCKVTGLDAAVLERLERHDWPGNVRELRNVLERAVIVAGEGVITMNHLPAGFMTPSQSPSQPTSDGDSVVLRVGATVADAEKGLILKTLEHTSNNKTRAAEILGISLKTLHNKLKEYGAA